MSKPTHNHVHNDCFGAHQSDAKKPTISASTTVAASTAGPFVSHTANRARTRSNSTRNHHKSEEPLRLHPTADTSPKPVSLKTPISSRTIGKGKSTSPLALQPQEVNLQPSPSHVACSTTANSLPQSLGRIETVLTEQHSPISKIISAGVAGAEAVVRALTPRRLPPNPEEEGANEGKEVDHGEEPSAQKKTSQSSVQRGKRDRDTESTV